MRKGKKGRLRPGHPWIFKNTILKAEPGIRPGDIITVVNSENKFIGRGYYNPASEISARLLTFEDKPIDHLFLRKKINDAVEKRDSLSGITSAKRIIFSEADGLPGLIADLYNDTLVLQVFTLGMDKLKETVLEIIQDIIKPRFVYEKSDSLFRKIEGLKPAKGWRGDKGETRIEIYEGRAKFIVDIENGHKTGFYLDQRRSRLALGGVSKGRTVLDLFCYTGGFSINAALGGAKKVIGVDIKAEWLSLAGENAALNGILKRVFFKTGDAFEELKNICNSGEKFDIIIIDPPSFAKDRKSVMTASKGYEKLNALALQSLNDNGILCTFSCSHSISNDIFAGIIKESAASTWKKLTILKRCRQDKDHPIVKSIPETEYLKGYFFRVNSLT